MFSNTQYFSTPVQIHDGYISMYICVLGPLSQVCGEPLENFVEWHIVISILLRARQPLVCIIMLYS